MNVFLYDIREIPYREALKAHGWEELLSKRPRDDPYSEEGWPPCNLLGRKHNELTGDPTVEIETLSNSFNSMLGQLKDSLILIGLNYY